VLLGCAHAGLINTLEWVKQITGETRIAAVLGGLHLVRASPERLAFTTESLERLGVQRLLPCHCTGAEGMAFLESRLGGRVRCLRAGGGLSLEDLP
jgi:7,8-dihydropterin-6-yl-methyl-4-(beta-D-ribofuranosyl)aminobenzene 5'-phosphate synthase